MNGRYNSELSVLIIITLILFDVSIWHRIIFNKCPKTEEIYFLDVGQGDSELLILPGCVSVLTDAGPNSKISRSIENTNIPNNHYIDLAIISHPQKDHFGGFIDLLGRYSFGSFIINGREADKTSINMWKEMISKIKKKNIPLVIAGMGDKISYLHNKINFLSPNPVSLQSGDLNDTSIVELVKTPSFKALLTGDIGQNIEEYLSNNFDAKADILKVPHHGSKYSSSKIFLEKVNPKISIIEVGAGNRYKFPSSEALKNILSSTHSKIFRTDRCGNIKILPENGKLEVFTSENKI